MEVHDAQRRRVGPGEMMATAGTSLNDQVAFIRSREDRVGFIRDLQRDHCENPEDWENSTLDEYLDALAAWSEDMDGYFQGRGEPVPPTPSWNLVAMMLLAAKRYE